MWREQDTWASCETGVFDGYVMAWKWFGKRVILATALNVWRSPLSLSSVHSYKNDSNFFIAAENSRKLFKTIRLVCTMCGLIAKKMDASFVRMCRDSCYDSHFKPYKSRVNKTTTKNQKKFFMNSIGLFFLCRLLFKYMNLPCWHNEPMNSSAQRESALSSYLKLTWSNVFVDLLLLLPLTLAATAFRIVIPWRRCFASVSACEAMVKAPTQWAFASFLSYEEYS